jgi:hypothetical protein
MVTSGCCLELPSRLPVQPGTTLYIILNLSKKHEINFFVLTFVFASCIGIIYVLLRQSTTPGMSLIGGSRLADPILYCTWSVVQDRLTLLYCTWSVAQDRLTLLYCTWSVVQDRLTLLYCTLSVAQDRLTLLYCTWSVVQDRLTLLYYTWSVVQDRLACCTVPGLWYRTS